MSPDQIQEIFTLILSAWPTQRQRMSKRDVAGMAITYVAGLSDLNYELTKVAMIRLTHTHEWIPTIAAIREAVGVIVHGQRKTGIEAWGSVHRAQQDQGSHRTLGVDFTFADPITAAVVRQIGWLEICASSQPDHIRARFIDAYEEISKQERVEAQASPGAVTPALSRAERQTIPGHIRNALHGAVTPTSGMTTQSIGHALDKLVNEGES